MEHTTRSVHHDYIMTNQAIAQRDGIFTFFSALRTLRLRRLGGGVVVSNIPSSTSAVSTNSSNTRVGRPTPDRTSQRTITHIIPQHHPRSLSLTRVIITSPTSNNTRQSRPNTYPTLNPHQRRNTMKDSKILPSLQQFKDLETKMVSIYQSYGIN
jgi:hypothetical protein